MKPRIIFVMIILTCLIQAAILPGLGLGNVQPDLLLIWVVAAGLSCELRGALILALLAGFLKDLFNAGPFGTNTLLFPLWVYLLKEFSKRAATEAKILRVILVFIIVVAHGLTTRFIGVALGNNLALGIFLRVLVIESFSTALVSLLIFKVSA